MLLEDKIEAITGFDWDAGNSDKNRATHGVSMAECEQLFFNRPLIVLDDGKHSHIETRYHALGKSNEGRLLFAAFTVRKTLIRVISARDMHKKERLIYEKENSSIQN